MGRAPCCDKDNVKRGPWSPEEDATLRDYIERNGTGGNWITLPQKAGLRRCGKSCRLRWLNYLRPNIKHGGFTEEEDNIICALFKAIGSRWSVIASHLQGRTDNDVKNYWNTKLKKKLLKASEPSPSMNQPQLPPFVPSFVKTEDFSGSNNWGFDFVQDPYRFFQELPPLPMQEMNANASCTNPKAEESPAASSFGSSSRDDVFLSEMGFESYSELLNGHGDVASFYSSSSLGVKGEELYHRVANYS